MKCPECGEGSKCRCHKKYESKAISIKEPSSRKPKKVTWKCNLCSQSQVSLPPKLEISVDEILNRFNSLTEEVSELVRDIRSISSGLDELKVTCRFMNNQLREFTYDLTGVCVSKDDVVVADEVL